MFRFLIIKKHKRNLQKSLAYTQTLGKKCLFFPACLLRPASRPRATETLTSSFKVQLTHFYKPGRLDRSKAYNTIVFNLSWRLPAPCVPSLHECNTTIIFKRLFAHRIPHCVTSLNHPFCEFSDCNM